MATYLRKATAVPALQVYSSLINPGVDNPPSAIRIAAGDTVISVPHNNVANRTRIALRHGGGAYAVAHGLELSSSGLVLTVTAGQALLDDPATLADSTTAALVANSENFIWIGQSANIQVVASSLAAPAGVNCYLGMVYPTSGAGAVDYSGRPSLYQGNLLWRKTADEAAPGDTPSSAIRFFNETEGGVYLWTGSEYVQISQETVELEAEVAALRQELLWLRYYLGRLYGSTLGLVDDPEVATYQIRALGDPYSLVP